MKSSMAIMFQVSPDVKAISASESGELWAVLDRVVPDSVIPGLVDVLVGPGSNPGAPNSGLQLAANARGVLARRSGVTPEQVAGTGWDIALGVSQMKYFHSILKMLDTRDTQYLYAVFFFREVGNLFPFGVGGRTNKKHLVRRKC